MATDQSMFTVHAKLFWSEVVVNSSILCDTFPITYSSSRETSAVKYQTAEKLLLCTVVNCRNHNVEYTDCSRLARKVISERFRPIKT